MIENMQKPQQSHADSIISEMRNSNLRVWGGSQKPAQLPLKTGNIVADAQRQMQSLAKWERDASAPKIQASLPDFQPIYQSKKIRESIIHQAEREEKAARSDLLNFEKRIVKFEEPE